MPFDPEYVREVSTAVYRSRFSDFDRERILADPDRGERFFVQHSKPFDSLTRSYLDTLTEIGLREKLPDVRKRTRRKEDADAE